MITALEGDEGQRHAPAALYPRERPGTHCTGGWVGPRAGLDRCGKSRPPTGFNPWTVQPIASHYTDYATWPTMCIYWRVKELSASVYITNQVNMYSGNAL